MQSAFVSALAALQRDSRNAPLWPWLYRIAHNEAVSVLRRRGTRAKLRAQLEHQTPITAHRSADRERLEFAEGREADCEEIRATIDHLR